MAKGKRFYKTNNNAPAGQGAPAENNANNNVNAVGGKNVNTRYEGKPDGVHGSRSGKPGPGPANKPGGKPPRRFKKGSNRDGNGEQNANRRENHVLGNANRNGNRPDGYRSDRPRFENRKPQVGGKVLVAYFSWSGVTETAARKIASVVKGNSYRIMPVNAYPSMYALCVGKAGMEKASGARPEIKGSLPDCSRYEKIAIGFPVWWFGCPNIIHSFLEKVNLEGKKVYPFCTSKSSGPRNSAEAIRNTVPKADVKDCLDANKLDAMSDEEIKKWLEM